MMIDTQKAREYGQGIVTLADRIDRLDNVRSNKDNIKLFTVNGTENTPLALSTTDNIATRVTEFLIKEVEENLNESEKALSELIGNNIEPPLKKKTAKKPSKRSS
jgi:hypothetical protein